MTTKAIKYTSIKDIIDYESDESTRLEQLKTLLSADPDLARERTDRLSLLLGESNIEITQLHLAAIDQSVEFCKLLVELDPEAVRTCDDFDQALPIHLACGNGNIETAKYLLQLYPESINIPSGNFIYGNHGDCPIHCFIRNLQYEYEESIEDDELGLIHFFLEQDEDAMSKRNRDNDELPLHIACKWCCLNLVRLVFNAYPEAMYCRTKEGDTPLDVAREDGNLEVLEFLDFQLYFVEQARVDTRLDSSGQLPIHHSLGWQEISLGAVKLMIEANPGSVRLADYHGTIPLHDACRFGHIDIAKHLMQVDETTIKTSDLKGNTALHHACLGGNFDLVGYILQKSEYGASRPNMDGKLPIELLVPKSNVNDMKYVETFFLLLTAYPAMREIFSG